MSMIVRLIAAAMVLFVHSGGARAQTDAPPPPSESPAAVNNVKMGMFITQINDFNMKRGSFDITFWAWFLTKDSAYKPIETIEVVNAKTATTRYPSVQKKPDFPWENGKADVFWHQAKYNATVTKDWSVENYPFDRQELKIFFEDAVNDASTTTLTPDIANTKIDDDVGVAGWKLLRFDIYGEDNKYSTNYGDVTGTNESTYSRVIMNIVVERNGAQIMINAFLGFYVSFLLVLITYCMGTINTGSARIGLVAAAIFAAIGNKTTIDNALPESTNFSVADGVELASFSAIIFALVVAVVVIWLSEKYKKGVKTFNAIAAVTSVCAYVGFIAYLVIRAKA